MEERTAPGMLATPPEPQREHKPQHHSPVVITLVVDGARIEPRLHPTTDRELTEIEHRLALLIVHAADEALRKAAA